MYAISISTTVTPTAINPNSNGTPRAGLVTVRAATGTSAASISNPTPAFVKNNNTPTTTNAGRDGLGSAVELETRADVSVGTSPGQLYPSPPAPSGFSL